MSLFFRKWSFQCSTHKNVILHLLGLLKQPNALFSYQKWPIYVLFYVHGRKFYTFLWIRDKFSIRIYDESSTPATEPQTNHKIISNFSYLNSFHMFHTGFMNLNNLEKCYGKGHGKISMSNVIHSPSFSHDFYIFDSPLAALKCHCSLQ